VNGVSLVQIELPEAPVVCLDLWCRAGSACEGEPESGLAHFLEHMVFKGSEQLDAGEFDLKVEALGGNSNAATGFDDVHYHVLIPPQAAPEALDLLLDLVLQPRLDGGDFAMERQVVLEELAQSEDQPEEVAFQELLRQACGSHAYGLPILGRREALEAHTPEAMAAFHRRHYRADRCCLSVAGPLAGLELETRLNQSPLAALQPSEPLAPVPNLTLQPGRDRIDSVMGGDLLTTLLAEGRRSRLVEQLRERLRLVESIDLDLNVLESGCLVLLEAVCDPEQLPAVEQQVRQVLLELIEQAPKPAELDRAKRLVGNGYRFSLEVAGSVAAMVGNSQLWGRRHNLQRPLEWLEGWSSERLSREVIPLLHPDRAFCLQAVPA